MVGKVSHAWSLLHFVLWRNILYTSSPSLSFYTLLLSIILSHPYPKIIVGVCYKLLNYEMQCDIGDFIRENHRIKLV